MAVNKTELVAFRMKAAEKVLIMEAANARDLRLSEYIRGAIETALATDRNVAVS
jgi:uncharacterized protein (DUF1778 family)